MIKKLLIVFLIVFCLPFHKATAEWTATDHALYKDAVPFAWLGDTAWYLMHATYANANTYLANREAKGFTVIHAGCLGWAPDNINQVNDDNVAPFVGTPTNVGAARNAAYWDNINNIINNADARGINIGLLPINANEAAVNATWLYDSATAYAYGYFLGSTFTQSNIIWILGGDSDVTYVPLQSLTRYLARGIADGNAGLGSDSSRTDDNRDFSTTIMTFHPCSWPTAQTSSSVYGDDPWLDINFIQTGSDHRDEVYTKVYSDYLLDKPSILSEGRYYDPYAEYYTYPGTAYTARQEAYWSFTAGGHYTFGSIYGMGSSQATCCNSDVVTNIDSDAIESMAIFNDFIDNIDWYNYSPDQSLILSGMGSGTSLNSATIKSNNSAIIYLSTVSSSITVDMSLLNNTSNINVTRINPLTGARTNLGVYSTTGSQVFTTGGLSDAILYFGPIDYYVTQTGDGNYSGSSLDNAMAITTFNALTGTYAGNTFYFSGTFTTTIWPIISGTSTENVVTLDGLYGDDCDPITSECTAANGYTADSALIDKHAQPSYSGIWLGWYGDVGAYINYMTIQDFRITGSDSTSAIYIGASGGTQKAEGSNYITLRRNYIYECYAGIESSCYSTGCVSGLTTIPTNTYITIGGMPGQGNKIFNCATGGQSEGGFLSMMYKTNHIVESYNEYGVTDYETYGAEGVYHYDVNYVLVENNKVYGLNNTVRGEKCIGFKGRNSYLIARYNDMSYCQELGLHLVNYNQHAYVYGNRVYNSGAGIAVGAQNLLSFEGCDDVGGCGNAYPNDLHIWSNLIYNIDTLGIYTWSTCPDPYTCSMDDINFINNTIANCGGSNDYVYRLIPNFSSSGFYSTYGTNIAVKNNIFYENWSDSAEQEIWTNNGVNITLGDNNYYDSTGAATLTGIAMEGDAEEANPGFTNVGASDYTLNGTNNVGEGTDLSECFEVTIQGILYEPCIDNALDPNTDWTTTPPTVSVVNRDAYGWARGAYAYTADYEEEITTIIKFSNKGKIIGFSNKAGIIK